MKKYILSLCSLVAMVACQTFDDPTINNGADVDADKVTVTANINGSEGSRVAITPATDSEGKPKLKVDWKESGEKFLVYAPYHLNTDAANATPTEFTQVSGNQFTGEFPCTDSYYYAFYNCTFTGATTLGLKLTYDVSQQDGTLSDNSVLMMGQSNRTDSGKPLAFDFDHLGFILKPTFKYKDFYATEAVDLDTSIVKIEMENVQYAKTDTEMSKNQTITITPSEQDDIYIFLPKLQPYLWNSSDRELEYNAGHTFTFAVTTENGDEYTGSLTLPKSLEVGKYYTATINLEPHFTHLPTGEVFRDWLMRNINEDAIAKRMWFVTKDEHALGEPLPGTYGCPVYLHSSGDAVVILTMATKFVFNPNSSEMFAFQRSTMADDATKEKFKGLSRIALYDCNTSLVTDMSYMFADNEELIEIEYLNTFDTSNVTTMRCMFDGCGSTPKLYQGLGLEFEAFDLSSFDTSKVTDMSGMFYLYGGKSLDLSGFDTSNVVDMMSMFGSAGRLEMLDIRNFNFDKIGTYGLSAFFHNIGYGSTWEVKPTVYIGSQHAYDQLMNANTYTEYVNLVIVGDESNNE